MPDRDGAIRHISIRSGAFLPHNGWLMDPLNMDDLGLALFQETPKAQSHGPSLNSPE